MLAGRVADRVLSNPAEHIIVILVDEILSFPGIEPEAVVLFRGDLLGSILQSHYVFADVSGISHRKRETVR